MEKTEERLDYKGKFIGFFLAYKCPKEHETIYCEDAWEAVKKSENDTYN